MRRGLRRLIPLIFLIIIVVLVIAAIISVARLFTKGSTQQPITQDTSLTTLLDTSVKHSVRMTVRGPIVGDENFRSYTITVTPDSRDFVRYKGYLDQKLESKHYSNNTKAYDEFVHALAKANLATGTQLSGDADDTRGVCAEGVLYRFEIRDGDTAVKQLWTSTCRSSVGSLRASADTLRELFLAQVPDAVAYIGKN